MTNTTSNDETPDAGSWTWRCQPEATGASSPGFATREAAEAWMSDRWSDLLEAGVAQVTLMDGGREIYGPMPLTA